MSDGLNPFAEFRLRQVLSEIEGWLLLKQQPREEDLRMWQGMIEKAIAEAS